MLRLTSGSVKQKHNASTREALLFTDAPSVRHSGSGQIETIQVHYLGPGGNEVLDQLLLPSALA